MVLSAYYDEDKNDFISLVNPIHRLFQIDGKPLKLRVKKILLKHC